MKTKFAVLAAIGFTLAALLAAVQAADEKAESKVTLTDMHICCKSCQTAIEKAVATVPEAKCKVDTNSESTVITASNNQSLQKAVDEVLKAGFAGKADNKDIKIAPIKASDEKVAKLEIEHADIVGGHLHIVVVRGRDREGLAIRERMGGIGLEPMTFRV